MGIRGNAVSKESEACEHIGLPALNERIDWHILSFIAWGTPVDPDLLIVSYRTNDARKDPDAGLICREKEGLVDKVRSEIKLLNVLTAPWYMNNYELGRPYWYHADPDIFKRIITQLSI